MIMSIGDVQSATLSDHKHHNTAKAIVSMASIGNINLFSDQYIVEHSKYLDI